MKKILPGLAKNPQGFTLVELLVVISIIAILSIIGMTVFTAVQKNARDARRKSDINDIAKAFEIYANPGNANKYSALSTTQFSTDAIPTDPGTYTYNYATSGASNAVAGNTFTVCAQLENGNGNYSSSTTVDSIIKASGSSANYFCQKNKQ